MKYFVKLLGALILIGGIGLAIYLGLWTLFIGGIIGIVQFVVALMHGQSVQTASLAWSILKIIVASPVGGIIAYVSIVIGLAFMG